jgi:hypothetical protein
MGYKPARAVRQGRWGEELTSPSNEGDAIFAPLQQSARAYRYGRGDMQIHLALSEPRRWRDPALGDVVMLHLTSGVDAIATAIGEAKRGFCPPGRPSSSGNRRRLIPPARQRVPQFSGSNCRNCRRVSKATH